VDETSLADRVASVLREAGVQAAYLFGSRARGSARATSDLDIAVLTGRHIGLLEEQRLADALGQAVGMPVDVVVLDRASLELRGRVVQEGELVFSQDEPARVAFEVRTRSEYFDFLPTLRMHTESYLRRVARGSGDGRP
jgi:uncharacterized protein